MYCNLVKQVMLRSSAVYRMFGSVLYLLLSILSILSSILSILSVLSVLSVLSTYPSGQYPNGPIVSIYSIHILLKFNLACYWLLIYLYYTYTSVLIGPISSVYPSSHYINSWLLDRDSHCLTDDNPPNLGWKKTPYISPSTTIDQIYRV